MNIDKHYPFEVVPLNYSLTCFDDFLDFQSLSIHYNQIYTNYVNKLNNLIKNYPTLTTISLDEILFNPSLIPLSIREDVINNASGAYNHQIIFSSSTPNNKVMPSKELNQALISSFGSIDNFYKVFKEKALNLNSPGFVFLVCDETGNLKIEKVKCNTTTVIYNLCPILGLDMYEHAYFLKYKTNKEEYIDKFLKYINFDFVNSEYKQCLDAINIKKQNSIG